MSFDVNTGAAHTSGTAILKGAVLSGAADVFDIAVENGRVADIAASASPAQRLLTPLMADAHVHLDKTHTVTRTGSAAKTLFEAIDLMEADKPHWSEADLRERASRALEEAWLSGVAAMRSHVDWMSPETPVAWSVFNELRQEWRGRIDLQLAALAPLDMLAEIGPHIAPRLQADQGVLGAFVYRNERTADKLSDLFDLSRQYGLPLDFHVDEGLEPEANGFDEIVRLAGSATDAPPVLCGHACSLSIRPEDDVRQVLDAAAEAQVGLVALPTTNAYLQDNTDGQTPRRRGIAPIKEARAAGVDVILASDNVRDVFFPYGSYDLFDAYRMAVQFAHLSPENWLPAISTRAGAWCGSDICGLLKVGQSADFIEFEATSLNEAVSTPGANRRVWRNGVVTGKRQTT